MSADDIEPAFPAQDYGFTGMTLRDYFAAQAMCVYLRQAYAGDQGAGRGWDDSDVAAFAYDMADAMLAERAK